MSKKGGFFLLARGLSPKVWGRWVANSEAVKPTGVSYGKECFQDRKKEKPHRKMGLPPER